LSGAQRTGKSTLARLFAEENSIPFVETATSAVFSALKIDPKAELSFEKRLGVQEIILKFLERQYVHAASVAPVWIADRTPIDFMAYTLADIQRSTLVGKPWLAEMVQDYMKRCYESANRWFSTIVLVQPGIPLADAPGKAPACAGHQEHHNALCLGLMADERLHCKYFHIPRRYVSLDDRARCLQSAIRTAAETHQARMAQAVQAANVQVH
jgi:predicted ATPase